MGVTAVKKDVVVLLDAGNSMGDSLPGDLLVTTSTTKFQALVSMLTSFLDTLAIGDRITIVTFTSSAAASSVLSPVSNQIERCQACVIQAHFYHLGF